MARPFTSKSFVVDHEAWFKDNFGFVPSQYQLEMLFLVEGGAAKLLLGIFSEKYLQREILGRKG